MKLPLFLRRLGIVLLLASLAEMSSAPAIAHPTHVASAILTLNGDDTFHLLVTYDVAASVMQSEQPGHLSDEAAEQLGSMSEAMLQRLIADARQIFARRTIVRCDGRAIESPRVEFPPMALLREGDTTDAGRKPQTVHLFGRVPSPTNTISVTLPPDCGELLLTVVRADDSVVRFPVAEGAACPDVTWREARESRSSWSVAAQYLLWGFEHILPKGLDHILFVLGLYLLNPQWRPLLWQVTMFTLAHSLTLALSSWQLVALPASVVEPLIALSIAAVAIENLLTSELHRWRLPLVFGFGLLHGLGFAGVLGELGLPPNEYLVALVTFNLGVELGQLAVLGLATLCVGWCRHQSWYRWAVVQPVSAAIAVVGLYWTIERLGWLG